MQPTQTKKPRHWSQAGRVREPKPQPSKADMDRMLGRELAEQARLDRYGRFGR